MLLALTLLSWTSMAGFMILWLFNLMHNSFEDRFGSFEKWNKVCGWGIALSSILFVSSSLIWLANWIL